MQAAVSDEQSTYTVLVTGANSGLGFATCCRLVDEFLFIRPQSQSLHLIATTRDQRKNDDTLKRLRAHLQNTLREANGRTMGISILLEPRIRLSGELVDLCSLVSVKSLAKRLIDRGQRLDALILNAGIGGWSGLNWPVAIWSVLTDWVQAVTYPTYKNGYVGNVTKRQIVSGPAGDKKPQQDIQEQEEPVLGETFTANVFGHYMLAHMLIPLMTTTINPKTQGEDTIEQARIIWISSLEAYAYTFNPDDLQALKSDASYESSKRLTDLLVLTSDLASTKPYVSHYLSPSPIKDNTDETKHPITTTLPPKLYLAHPGICGTSIANLHPILEFFMYMALYVARFLGSPWHTISAYLGACSPVWLALQPTRELDVYEGVAGRGSPARRKGKWGSSTDLMGKERVVLTEVEGWGWSGRVGETADGNLKSTRGRWRRLPKNLTREKREEFEVLGARVWKEMEELRDEWEKRLEKIGDVVKEDM